MTETTHEVETYICGLVIEYGGDEITGEVMMKGSEEECKRFMANPPARLIQVAETAKDATLLVLSEADWNAMLGVSMPTATNAEPTSTTMES